MTVVLGIDPGSRVTGFGLVRHAGGQKSAYITSGCVRATLAESAEFRLNEIYSGIKALIAEHQPDEIAIERIFMARSAESALKLGQARGVALLAASRSKTPLYEYEAKKVKQAVVGHGAAKKDQVQHMVQVLLRLSGPPQEDAADALAIALCHSQTGGKLARLGSASGTFRRGRIVESER